MTDNAAANAKLRAFIEKLRDLPTALVKKGAPDVAQVSEALIRESIAAGRAPDGAAWELTAQGKRPLRNAGKALSSFVDGTRVVLMLQGPEALHHKGQVSGSIRRQILPTRRIPQTMLMAIRRVFGVHFRDHMGSLK